MRRLLAVVALVLATTGGCDAVQSIGYWFHDDAPAATRVARCESGLNPAAVSPGGGNHGLFQINSVHRGQFEAVTGRPWSDRYDAFQNSRYAADLFHREGWSPWTCKP